MLRPSRLLVAPAAALCLVLGLAACTGDADDDVDTPPSTPPSSSSATAATGQPFETGAAQWRTGDSDLRRARVLGVGRTSILVRGGTGRDQVLAVHDRESGAERWRRRLDDARSYVASQARVGAAKDDPVLVPFEVGVVALDQASGRERWRWSPPGPVSSTAGLPVQVRAAGEEGVTVLRVESPRRGGAVALDSRTGRLLWRSPGEVVDVAHGFVLVRRGGVPVLVDVRTGTESWRGEARQVVKGLLDDVVLVADPDDTGGSVVDLGGTGEAARVDALVGRLPLGGDLLVWYDDDTQFTLALGEDEPVTAPAPQTPDGRALDLLTVVDTRGGYVFHQLDESLFAVGRDGQVAGRVESGADASVTIGADYLLIDDDASARADERVLGY